MLYDFIECVIHRLTFYVDSIKVIDYKNDYCFFIGRYDSSSFWKYNVEEVSQYKIISILQDNEVDCYENPVVTLNIVVERI
jgi:hypothetical protein